MNVERKDLENIAEKIYRDVCECTLVPVNEAKKKALKSACRKFGITENEIIAIDNNNKLFGWSRSGLVLTCDALYGEELCGGIICFSDLLCGSLPDADAKYISPVIDADQGEDGCLTVYLDNGEVIKESGLSGCRADIVFRICRAVAEIRSSDVFEEVLEKLVEGTYDVADSGKVAELGKKAFEMATGCRESGDVQGMLKYLETGVMFGNPDSACNMGIMYFYGSDVEKDYRKAYGLFMFSAARGKVPAMLNLAMMYEKGRGIDRDLMKAGMFYCMAAENGSEIALEKLPEFDSNYNEDVFLEGRYLMKEGRFTDAAERFRRSFSMGCGKAAEALEVLSRYFGDKPEEMFRDGMRAVKLGKPEDGLKLIKDAAMMGNIEAAHYLGSAYREDSHTDNNMDEAIGWFSVAAESGSAADAAAVADIYASGERGSIFVQGAVKWYTLSAELGNADAASRAWAVYNRSGSSMKYVKEYLRKCTEILLANGKQA